jgi:hypothetical protein
MKKIKYDTKIDADLWLELNRRAIKKSKIIRSNSILDLSRYPKEKLPDDHWFVYQAEIDSYLYEFSLFIMDKSEIMLEKVYAALSDEDKKIIDEYHEELKKEGEAQYKRMMDGV